MTREEIMLWLEHLANRETVPECREALETASWIIYGCPEDVVKSYSAVVAKPALARVLLAEGKSIDEVRKLLQPKERDVAEEDKEYITYDALDRMPMISKKHEGDTK